MDKKIWKPGTMLYPLPAILVTCGEYKKDGPTDKSNIITISWAGTICTDPAMASISIRPSRYSYGLIEKSGEFVINLTTKRLVFAADFCGVKSGSEVNKFEKCSLTAIPAKHVKAPLIQESPINIECRVKEIKKLGSHDMFIADVLCVHADYRYVDKKGAFDLSESEPICYSHGKYYALGKYLGYFGYSVRK